MLKSVKMFFKNKYNYRKRRKTPPFIPWDTRDFKLVGQCSYWATYWRRNDCWLNKVQKELVLWLNITV